MEYPTERTPEQYLTMLSTVRKQRGGNLVPLWRLYESGHIDMFQIQSILDWMTIERLQRQYRNWSERRR